MFRLPPEVEEELARARAQEGHYRQAFANLTNASLVASAKFWMQHSSLPRRFAPDEPVYDATLWHVIVPELLRRVESEGNQDQNRKDHGRGP